MRITILTNGPSNSARNLQSSLDHAGIEATRARPNSHLRCRGTRYVVNLGCSAPVTFQQGRLLISNSCEAVAACQDKMETLEKLDDANVPTLEWVGNSVRPLHDAALPRTWLRLDEKIVVRHTTTGHSGHGIAIVRRGSAIPDAPLYTRYFRKHAEYRVHVAFGNVILIQQKRRRNGIEHNDEQSLIRTHANGWVFATNNLSCDERGYTERLRVLAIAAANAVGAQHCAVDILVNHESNQIVVCEINSAPALEADSTLAAYTAAFSAEIRRHA